MPLSTHYEIIYWNNKKVWPLTHHKPHRFKKYQIFFLVISIEHAMKTFIIFFFPTDRFTYLQPKLFV